MKKKKRKTASESWIAHNYMKKRNEKRKSVSKRMRDVSVVERQIDCAWIVFGRSKVRKFSSRRNKKENNCSKKNYGIKWSPIKDRGRARKMRNRLGERRIENVEKRNIDESRGKMQKGKNVKKKLIKNV